MKKLESIKVTVAQADDGLRLEVWLARNVPGLSRNKAIEAIRNGEIWIEGRKAKKGRFVTGGEMIEIRIPEKIHTVSVEPTVVFESKTLIVANKPAGVPCHPLRLGEIGTLLQWVGERFPEVLKAGKETREGGLLHRLDTDTSGCVAFARDRKTFDEMRPRFAEGGIGKIYLAVVHDGGSDGGNYCGDDCGSHRCGCCGDFPGDDNNIPKLPPIGKSVVVKIPLGRHPSDGGRMVALIDGEERHKGLALSAKTTIRTLAKGKDCALVEAIIERGRMHQIRVHLAAIGHPIVGDSLYQSSNVISSAMPVTSFGKRFSSGYDQTKIDKRLPIRASQPKNDNRFQISRQALHAWKLIIDKIEAIAPLPEDFRKLCEKRGVRIPNTQLTKNELN